MLRKLRCLHRVERALQRGSVGDHGLPAPAGRPHQLDAHRPALKQALAGATGVRAGEGGEAGKDGAAHPAPELGRPAGRRGRVRTEEWVRDRLGHHEGVGHDAAEQVVLAAHPERRRRPEPDQGVARHEVDRARVARARVIFPREVEAFEGGQPPRDPFAGGPFVAVGEAASGVGEHGHDAALHTGKSHRVRCSSPAVPSGTAGSPEGWWGRTPRGCALWWCRGARRRRRKAYTKRLGPLPFGRSEPITGVCSAPRADRRGAASSGAPAARDQAAHEARKSCTAALKAAGLPRFIGCAAPGMVTRRTSRSECSSASSIRA